MHPPTSQLFSFFFPSLFQALVNHLGFDKALIKRNYVICCVDVFRRVLSFCHRIKPSHRAIASNHRIELYEENYMKGLYKEVIWWGYMMRLYDEVIWGGYMRGLYEEAIWKANEGFIREKCMMRLYERAIWWSHVKPSYMTWKIFWQSRDYNMTLQRIKLLISGLRWHNYVCGL